MSAEDEWTAVIIEDDEDVRDLINIVLTQSGFRTIVAENGQEGVEAVKAHDPLITTLDVNMPGMDGFAVAKRLREFSSTYLIMITALADEIDVVQGLEAGADDYLVKPFRPRELRARADSMLRRPRNRQEVPTTWADPAPQPAPPVQETWATQAARDLTQNAPLQPLHEQAAPVQPVQPVQPAPQPAGPPVAPPVQPPVPQPVPQPVQHQPVPQGDGWLRFGDLALNRDTRVVTVGGTAVDLTRTEFDLLASLLETGRRVRSKADLVLTMRGQQYVTSYFVNEADKRSVEVHIANLRRKIGDDAATPRYVETVRGVGYRMAELF